MATGGDSWSLVAGRQLPFGGLGSTHGDDLNYHGEGFGRAVRERRQEKGLSLRQLASLVHCAHSHIADLESGRRQPSETLADQLGRVLDLADWESAPTSFETSEPISFRSHKFITGFLGSDVVKILREQLNARPVDGILSGHWFAPIRHASGQCELHIWNHGAIVAHLPERGEWASISDFAAWRYATYERDLAWLSDSLARIVQSNVLSAYVFSAYWLDDSYWPADQRDTALKLICMPRTLFGASSGETDTEERLLRGGFDHEDLKCFGVADISIAFASWSSVVYHSLDADRGLTEMELVRLELAVQSLWVFCSAVGSQIEEGRDPDTAPAHDWRWLRAARSRINTARANETGHHRSMREAILVTSGLPAMLDEIISVLREIQ